MKNAAEILALCESMGDGTEFKDYKSINLYRVKCVYVTRVIERAEEINELYRSLLDSDLYDLERTDSGGIAVNIKNAYGCYEVKEVTTESGFFKGIVITVVINNKVFVFKCGLFSVNEKTLNGWKTFQMFKSLCRRNGKNLEGWAIQNGLEVKTTISRPLIKMNPEYLYKRLSHVNHIDYNHAWCSGFLKEFPEFTPEMTTLLSRDKVLPSIFLGFCQSQYANYRFAHFAKAGIDWCNATIRSLAERLETDGYGIVGFNTDGIWYIDATGQGRTYHNEDEREGLGYWRTDHIDCDFRAYSDGQYWFIENGKFNVKARGFYAYEQEKPREEWDEIDFDKAMSNETSVKFIKGRGFVIHKCRER